MTHSEMNFETYTHKKVKFELRGDRGDWGLFCLDWQNTDEIWLKMSAGDSDWDGYYNHFSSKAAAKERARELTAEQIDCEGKGHLEYDEYTDCETCEGLGMVDLI